MKTYKDYSDNNYGRKARITNDAFRDFLTSWQVPAIKEHFGTLQDRTFIDIGAGDIVLGEKLEEIGRPKKYYVQDLSQPSLEAGLKRLAERGVDTSVIHPLVSDNFDFSKVEDETIECAFSNSLFSHLSLNSIIMCLRNLRPKMKPGSKYLSSMIVVPTEVEPFSYDWRHLNRKGANLTSFSTKDPYHYSPITVSDLLSTRTGFVVKDIHDYGHPFQKLVEFGTS